MTGPEHLREGKRLLAGVDLNSNWGEEAQARIAQSQAHLLAALTAVLVADRLEERTSWKEAAEA
ncbi:hypothetical protein [Streptomyces prunicolor]